MNKNIDKFSHLITRRWYIQSFNAVPAMLHLGGMTILLTIKNVGYGYRAIIKDYHNDFCEYAYDRDDLHSIAHEFEDRHHVDKNYLSKLVKQSDKLGEVMIDAFKKHRQKIKSYSDKQLIDEYKSFAKLYYEALSVSHIIEGYVLTRDIRLMNLLLHELEKKGLESEFSNYFNLLTQPIRKSFMNDYNNIIAKILNYIKQNSLAGAFEKNSMAAMKKLLHDHKPLHELFKNLETDFFWIRASYGDGSMLTVDDFLEEIKDRLKEKDMVKLSSPSVFKNYIAEKNTLIKKLKLCDALVEIVRITDIMMWWQDDRKRVILIGCCGMDMFLKEMSARFKIKHQYLRYLLAEEITLKTFKSFPVKMCQERIKGCFILYEGKKLDILTGDDYKVFKEALRKQEDGEELKEIRGMCASVGKALGKVHICKTHADIKAFKKGEILVTGMTRPEFVPAMNRAAAIVTDEGGITCHAAVISRELAKPCVIGTKIATKMLKNGDLVEVVANHSLVKIIETTAFR